MESDRERARRLLAAVRGLSPGVLEAAAKASPSSGGMIAAIRAALASPDPEAALVEAMRGITGVSEAALRGSRAALQDAAELAATAAPIRASLEMMIAGREQLLARAREAMAGVPGEEPELVAVVDRALALLGEDGPFAALRGALDAVRGIEHTLGQLARGEVDAPALARSAQQLRAEHARIATVRDELARVPTMIHDARLLAQRAGDTAALARLAAAEATLRAGEPGAEQRWQEALDRALDAQLLPLARDAAGQIALASASRDDFETVAVAAGRVAALAAQVGDVGVELATVGDEALARARLPGGAERARALVARARDLAAEDAVRVTRVRLLEGMVHEHLGEVAEARRAFRKVMDAARELDGVAYELGWAALHLGQLEAAAGQRFRAAQDLELAQEVGRAAGDLRLRLYATGARLELAADRREAEAMLGELDDDPAPVREALNHLLGQYWPAERS